MFKNLKAEMAREGLTGNGVASKIGLTGRSFSNKMLGNTEFTRSEMHKIKQLFFKLFARDFTLEYLFEFSDPDQKSA